MRGRPWLRLLLVVLAFAALAVPVWRLTRPVRPRSGDSGGGSTGDAPAQPPMQATECVVTAEFAPPPREFQVQHLGRTLLEGHGPQARFTGAWRVALPKEGADLALQVTWPGDGSAAGAVRLRVAFPDGRTVEKTFWTPSPPATENADPSATPPAPALVEIFTVPGSPGASS